MNIKTVIDAADHFRDDHTAFYYWMNGYVAAYRDIDGVARDGAWIIHDGGDIPVSSESVVEVETIGGLRETGVADIFSWKNVEREGWKPYDIHRYRIIKEK